MQRKLILYTALLFSAFFYNSPVHAQIMTAEQIVQQNLESYNKRDIEGFMSSFSDDIALYTFGETKPTTVGLVAVRQRYQTLFAQSPNLHSTIVKRMVLGNKVIDHERIVGRMGAATPVEMVLIYEVSKGKIVRVTAIRD
jgi:hypothetical protein